MNRPSNAIQLDFAPYLITEDGQVYSLLKNKYLKPGTRNEYKQVYLKCNNGKSKWFGVHRLVGLLYVPNPDNLPEIDHEDNNRANNHHTNLKWVTHQRNIQLSFERGRKVLKGEDHPNYGRGHAITPETKDKMREAKKGELHPKFKGYYTYQDKTSTSLNDLAIQLGTYPIKLKRLYNKGLIQFKPK